MRSKTQTYEIPELALPVLGSEIHGDLRADPGEDGERRGKTAARFDINCKPGRSPGSTLAHEPLST